MTKKLTKEDVNKKLALINSPIRLSGIYINSYTKAEFTCIAKGHKTTMKPNAAMHSKYGCKKCSGRGKITTEEASKKLLKHGFKLLEEMRGNKEKHKMQCLKCKTISNPSYSNVINGFSTCQTCKKENLHERYLKKLKQIDSDFIPTERYIKGNVRIEHICRTCGYIKPLEPNSTSERGYKCPFCLLKNYVDTIPDLEQEFWCDIKEFEGLYQVSTKGRIKALAKIREKNNSYIFYSAKIMIPKNDKDGYKEIGLYKNGHTTHHRVHRLVAEAFIPNPENKPQVNHMDEVKSNNSIENLEWVTCLENNRYGSKAKAFICNETGKIYYFQVDAAKDLDIERSNVSAVLIGIQKHAKGYTFSYI